MIDKKPVPLPQHLQPGMVLGTGQSGEIVNLRIDHVEHVIDGKFKISYTWLVSRYGGRHNGLANAETWRADGTSWPGSSWWLEEYVIEELPV